MKSSLVLFSCYIATIYAFITNNNLLRDSQYNKASIKAFTNEYEYDFITDDGELSWEDITKCDTKPPIKFPMSSFTDANCKQINDKHIDITMCTTNDKDKIAFNIDGVINRSFLTTNFVYSNEFIENLELILEDNVEFAVSVLVMTALMKQIKEKNEKYSLPKKIINSVAVGLAVILKSAKGAA